jgi:hypothetical protein
MQCSTSHRQRAQTQSRVARESIPLTERLGHSPAEFAALFGRSPTWGYRQIYAGRVKPIADCGRIIIPRAEIESVLARRREYNPTQTRGRTTPLEAAENATALQKHSKMEVR